MSESALRHGDGHLSAYDPAVLDELRVDPQGRAFVLRSVADESSVEIIRRSRRLGQHRGDQASGARLRRDDSERVALGRGERVDGELDQGPVDLDIVEVVCGYGGTHRESIKEKSIAGAPQIPGCRRLFHSRGTLYAARNMEVTSRRWSPVA